MKLKIIPQGISVFGVKSLEKLAGCISHCWWWAHFSLGWENRAKLWVGFVNCNGSPSWPPPICAEDISQPELGEAEFSEVWSCPCGDSSYIQILRKGACVCLPQPCLGFSLGRQPRTGFGWGCEHLTDNFARVWIGVNFFPCLSLPVD